ncbi:hypothetical protein [Kribbella sp.]|nr:hypothetical protein [Kribbella sp.]HZX08216.1 hypothetical protein [Kribbella sp.]
MDAPHEHMVGEAAGVEVFQYGEQVVADAGEQRIGRSVEDL